MNQKKKKLTILFYRAPIISTTLTFFCFYFPSEAANEGALQKLCS